MIQERTTYATQPKIQLNCQELWRAKHHSPVNHSESISAAARSHFFYLLKILGDKMGLSFV